jgi:hypothetical protein
MKKINLMVTFIVISISLSAQNVGIGTTSPQAKLHVNGTGNLARFGTGTTATTYNYWHTGNDMGSYIEQRGNTTSTGSDKFRIQSSIGGNALFYSQFIIDPNNGFSFLSNGAANGNVGIGIQTPASKLDVAGTIMGFDSYFGKTYPISAGTSGASYSSVGYGLTFTNTTGNYEYRLNDFSSMLSFRSGGFDFNTAPNGTAGSVIPYTTAMAILQNGNVGIGTTAPANKFYVMDDASNRPVAFLENTHGTKGSYGLHIKAGSNTECAAWFIVFLRPDGTQIGSVQQGVNCNTVNYLTASDKRLKNIIGVSPKGLPDLMKINVYDYSFKSDQEKKVETGFMAQELYDIFPQAVSKPRDNNEPVEKNPWMVDYGRVTPLIIKSVQEQQQQIELLKQQNELLLKELQAIKDKLK